MKNYQTGAVADLIFYGVLAAIAAGAFFGGVAWVNSQLDEHYAGPVRRKAESAAKLAAENLKISEGNFNTCATANKGLRAEIDNARVDIEAANAVYDELKRKSDILAAKKAASKDPDNTRIAELATQNFNLIAALSAPDPGGNCEQKMSRIDASLRQFGRDSVRFNPGSAESATDSGVGGTPAGAKGSRPDTVRIK